MKQVLVIEDNPDNLRLISYALRRDGYQVHAAMTGELGLQMIETVAPEFIIVDIDLPGIDGMEVTRRLRNGTKAAQIPIIAITSLAMAGDRERILAAGCNGYFEKPIDPLTIMQSIHRVLAQLPTGAPQMA